METFLLIVTITSLAGAAGMSIVAWKLLSDSRSRSAIRVATLQSLAFAASDDDSAVAPVHATPGATTAPMRATARFAALDSYEAEAPEAIEASAAPSPSFVAPIVNHDDPEMWDVTIDPAPRVAGATSPRTAVDARMFEPRTPVAGAGLRYAALGGLAAIVAAVAGTAYAVRETHAFTGLSFTQAWTTERARESSPQPLELTLAASHRRAWRCVHGDRPGAEPDQRAAGLRRRRCRLSLRRAGPLLRDRPRLARSTHPATWQRVAVFDHRGGRREREPIPHRVPARGRRGRLTCRSAQPGACRHDGRRHRIDAARRRRPAAEERGGLTRCARTTSLVFSAGSSWRSSSSRRSRSWRPMRVRSVRPVRASRSAPRVELINVTVTVTDDQGRFVPNLRAEDFTILRRRQAADDLAVRFRARAGEPRHRARHQRQHGRREDRRRAAPR